MESEKENKKIIIINPLWSLLFLLILMLISYNDVKTGMICLFVSGIFMLIYLEYNIIKKDIL